MTELHNRYIPFSELLTEDCFEFHPQHLLYEDEEGIIYEKKGPNGYSKVGESLVHTIPETRLHSILVKYCPFER